MQAGDEMLERAAVKSPVEVAYLHEFSTLNGGERSFLNFLDHVDRRRFRPVVLAPGEGGLAEEVAARQCEMVPWELRTEGRRRPFDEVVSELVAMLRGRGTRIIHGNSLSLGEYTGLAARQLKGVVGLSHIRDIQKLSRGRVTRLAQNDALIPVSHATALHLESQGLDRSILHTIWNGHTLPEEENRRPAVDLWPGDDGSAEVISCIGQICLRKAQDLAVEATLPLLEEREGLHLVLVGERFSAKDESIEFERSLLDRAREDGLIDRVHHVGYRPDVPSILARSTLLLHTAHQEPLGRVLIEAQAMGVAVVATKVGGTAEIIADGQTGLLVPRADIEALTTAMRRLLDQPASRLEMAERARLRAREQFDPMTSAGHITALYESLLQND
jgi:glycosyltransferase involved in cell wall biosynthesis